MKDHIKHTAPQCIGFAFQGHLCFDKAPFLHSFRLLDVGGYFETGTVVRYDLMSDSGAWSLREGRGGLSPLSTEANLTQEELTFSFSTSNSPSVLIYISSRTQDYLAVVLRHNGERTPAWLTRACQETIMCMKESSFFLEHRI